jgi:hypothetical protein
MESIKVTSAQKELLELLAHKEVHEYFESLKMIHYLGTYCVNEAMVELWASRLVHDLLDVIRKILDENKLADEDF